MSRAGGTGRRVVLTLRNGHPTQASGGMDFARSVQVESSSAHLQDSAEDHCRPSSVLPKRQRPRMMPDDPHYCDDNHSDDSANGGDDFMDTPSLTEDPEAGKPFKQKFHMDKLLGQTEPDPPDGASCEPQRTKRLTTKLIDAKTIEHLLELNKDKQKEYLRRTVWFKRLSKPLEAFQPDQVMIVSKYDCQKDPNPLKNLERILTCIGSIQRELKTECCERSDLLLDQLTFKKVLNQLTEGEVHICVLGRSNVGKSTIVNALLSEKIMPVELTAETALNVCIEHTNVGEPVLSHRSCKVHGTANIQEYLRGQHQAIRRKTIKLEERCTLQLRADFLSHETKRVKALLVDSPGSDEFDQDDLQKLAKANVDAAAAYIYVMPLDNAKAKEDYEIFKAIHARDKGIFQSERLTVVLSRMDTYYTQESSEQSHPDQMKKIVAENVAKAVDLYVSPELVYPVSGLWAVNAQEYMKSRNDKDFRRVRRAWEDIRDSEGTGEDKDEETHPQGIAEKMEKAHDVLVKTGIPRLQERISEIIKQLVRIGNQNILISCGAFLNSTKKCLDVLKKKADEEVQAAETNMTTAAGIAVEQEGIVESITEESTLLKYLKERSYGQDTAYTPKVEGAVKDFVEEEKTNFLKCIREKKYLKEDFERELIAKLLQRGKDKVMDLILSTRFKKCQRLVEKEVASISRKFGRIQFRLGATSTARHDLEEAEDDQSWEENLEFKEVMQHCPVQPRQFVSMKDFKIEVKIKRSWIFWKEKFEFVRIDEKDADKMFEDMENALQAMFKECFDDIKDEVVKRFFHWYCAQVDGYLACLNDFASKQLEKFKKRFEKLHGEYNEKKTLCTKLEKWLELVKVLEKDLQQVSYDLKQDY